MYTLQYGYWTSNVLLLSLLLQRYTKTLFQDTLLLYFIRSGSMANLQIAIEIASLGLEPKNQVSIIK